GDSQLSDGYRVTALANGPRFGLQVQHQLGGWPIELRAGLRSFVPFFIDRDFVRTPWKVLHFEATLQVRQNAAKYPRYARFQAHRHLARGALVRVQQHGPGNLSISVLELGDLRPCILCPS